ncbi:MAG: ABC transporter transmembrane domain-containing protein, partial [Actinomycetaceae bacterium]
MHVMIDTTVARYLRRAWPGLALTTLVTVLASVAAVAGAFGLAHAVTHVLARQPGLPTTALALAVLALLARGLLLLARDIVALNTGARATRQIRQQVLAHVFRLGPAHPWRAGRATVRLGVVDGCEHLRGYLGLYLPQAVAAALVPAVLVVVLARHSVAVAGVVVVSVALVPLAQRAARRLLGQRAHEHWDAYERYA